MRNVGHLILVARCSMLDARCSMLDARCSMLDARCSMLDARCGELINSSAAMSRGGWEETRNPKSEMGGRIEYPVSRIEYLEGW